MKKLSLLFAALLTATVFNLNAETVTNVKYIDAKGVEQTCASATVVADASSQVSWNAGWYVVTGTNITLSKGAICYGAVHLILADGAKLTAKGTAGKAGITVEDEYSTFLTIYGQARQTGQLIATSDEGGAGIGGESGMDGVNITINGGIVTATGSDGGAGIGGGTGGSGLYITINGGTVNATGGSTEDGDGAGIGPGKDGASLSIYVNPSSILKAGSSANPTTVINHTTNDISGNLMFSRYVTVVTPAATPDMHDFLYFVGLNGNDTVKLNKTNASLAATFQYSKDRINWSDYTWPDNSGKGGAAIDLKNAGDTVFFRAKGTNGKNATMSTGNAAYFQFAFGADDQIAAGGNIMSLYDASCEQDTMTEYGFYSLFWSAKQLVSAPKLPAKKLAKLCYSQMFFLCTSLIQAPELKATTLDIQCYTAMFYHCSSLQVDTCTGSCDGAELVVPTVSGTAPSNWNMIMFLDCKGAYANNIQLGGHYCIKEYVPVIEGVSLTGFDDTYDGENHSVEVSGTEEGDKIEFSGDSTTWQSTNPSFKSVVDTLIYVRVQREKYIDWGGSAKITITPKRLTLGGQYVETKTYDGNTTATIILDELNGVVEDDDVTVSATGEFEDKNAGYTKEVSAVYTLSGNDVGNYYMDDYTEEMQGDILVREIMLQSADLKKEYDGKALTAYSQTGGTTITDLTAGQTNNGYVDGECFTYSNFTGSQLIVGESDNTFDVSDSETALVSNYNITKEYGKLKVTALDPIAYIDANGQEQTCVQYIIVKDTTAQVTWNAGWYVVSGDVTLEAGAVCNGAVNLILADDAYLTATGTGANAGIEVSGTGTTLTIYGQTDMTGKLYASCVSEYACAIGLNGTTQATGDGIYVAGSEWTVTADDEVVPFTTTEDITSDLLNKLVVTIEKLEVPTSVQSIRGKNADQPIKFIENGQLLIIRNGKMFNAQGAVVE